MPHDQRPLPKRRVFIGALATALFAGTFARPGLAQQRTELWFIRHGESEINVAPLPHAVADDGVTYPLTRTGVRQALALAESMSALPIAGIYTSTRLRAIQTADAIAFRHGVNLTLAPEAVEIDVGIPNDAQNGSQMYRELVRKWVIDGHADARIGQGESLADAQRRFLPFVRELMNRHVDDRGVVVVLSHGATLGVLVPMLATNVPPDFVLRHPLSNTSIIKTELRDGRLFCTEWAGIGHTDFGD